MRILAHSFTVSLITLMCNVAPAEALTVGEFRGAYKILHALDPMTVDQRIKYFNEHKQEIAVANERLATAETIRKTVYRLNGLLAQQGAAPVLCNVELDDDDELGESLADWVNEFRADALERNRMLAGPASDKILDRIQLDDVIVHKLLADYPCPNGMQSAQSAQNTTTHEAGHHH